MSEIERRLEEAADMQASLVANNAKIGDMLILEAGAKAPSELDKGKVRADDWAITVDPRQEWRQLFDDAWRLDRDMFFDPAMRGGVEDVGEDADLLVGETDHGRALLRRR